MEREQHTKHWHTRYTWTHLVNGELCIRRSTTLRLVDICTEQQDRQPLLKAKYCPRVAAALCTQKNTPKNQCDLDLLHLKFAGFRAVVNVHVAAKFHEATVRTVKISEQASNWSARDKQEIWANAHETRDSISLISYAGSLGLSPVYFSQNSL